MGAVSAGEQAHSDQHPGLGLHVAEGCGCLEKVDREGAKRGPVTRHVTSGMVCTLTKERAWGDRRRKARGLDPALCSAC